MFAQVALAVTRTKLLGTGFLALFLVIPVISGAVISHDVSALNLVTPDGGGDDDGNATAIGVWFNMVSGESYVVTDVAGVPGKTNIADGRFELLWNTHWDPFAAQFLIQGSIPNYHAALGVSDGNIARLEEGAVIGSPFSPLAQFLDLAGTFGKWNAKGRGFLGLRFVKDNGTGALLPHYGYADITILPDNSIRLNGFAYSDVPGGSITTAYIGAPAPAAATALAVTGVTATTVALSWTDNSGTETGFRVERKTGAGAFGSVITLPADTTTYLDQGLAAATTYTYRVIATTGLDAAPTNTVDGTTLQVTVPPASPTAFTAIPDSPTSIQLSWTDNAVDEVGNRIERAVGTVGSFTVLITTGPGATTYHDTGLLPATEYRYRITATNGLDSPVAPEVATTTFSTRESTGALAAATAYPAIDGGGVVVGLWDFAAARATHQEFGRSSGGSRLTNIEGSATTDESTHTTHGAGIIAARGVDPTAAGVAPAAEVHVYDFNNDNAEMRTVGMQWPGQSDTLQIVNASYGPIRGWNSLSGSIKWYFNVAKVGGAEPMADASFGAYTSFARDMDETAAQRPYTLIVRSAGNDRDDGPAPSEFVYLSSDDLTASTPSVYDPALHPAGDGDALGGYGIVSDGAAAKNVLTVGPIAGARRDPETGQVLFAGPETGFGNWGPTTDGRIKPDLVAPGVNVRSASYTADDTYATITGSSQAAPMAAGAAALLVQAWRDAGPQRYLMGSTIKALLIHSADDIPVSQALDSLPGGVGPNPRTGWGMLNVKRALDDLIGPSSATIEEGRLTADQPQAEFEISVPMPIDPDGIELRATLAWTDPAGVIAGQDHASRLVHDLNLAIIDPEGVVHHPFVLPFALDAGASPDAPAIEAVNPVDTVEQVRIRIGDLGEPIGFGPSNSAIAVSVPRLNNSDGTISEQSMTTSVGVTPATYRVVVSLSGQLVQSEQKFSLVVTGGTLVSGAASPQPVIARESASPGIAEVLGANFRLGAQVTLRGPANAVSTPTGVEVTPHFIRFRHAALSDGVWQVDITNPDGAAATVRWGVGAAAQASSFEAWLGTHFSDAQLSDPAMTGAAADPDGWPLLAAYAFGADSGVVPANQRPAITGVSGNGTFSFVRRTGMTDATITVETSATLDESEGWHPLPPGDYGTPVDLGDGTELVTVTPLVAGEPRRFLRLRIERL